MTVILRRKNRTKVFILLYFFVAYKLRFKDLYSNTFVKLRQIQTNKKEREIDNILRTTNITFSKLTTRSFVFMKDCSLS